MATSFLDVIGAYGKNGWQDPETGLEYFNDRVSTEHGQLGKLIANFDEEFPVIVQADEVVLIRRGFPRTWDTPIAGSSIEWNPFGFQVFELVGKNGMVRYRLYDEQLAWRRVEDPEDNEEIAKWQIGVRTYSKWAPMLAGPDRTRNDVYTTKIQ